MAQWNLWHGCRKYSEGCQNCYVYRSDERYGRDASRIEKTSRFYLPVAKNRNGEYKIAGGQTVWTCFTSDFFLEEADIWRDEAWQMIKERADLHFFFITKRITRFYDCIPFDWGDGYDNVTICCTAENQRQADIRLPVYLTVPVKHKIIICEPLLGPMDLSPYLQGIDEVVAGGESGKFARDCKYEWILDIREKCIAANVSFRFKQTGAYFVKNGRRYAVPRRFQHSQAKKAGINFVKQNEKPPYGDVPF